MTPFPENGLVNKMRFFPLQFWEKRVFLVLLLGLAAARFTNEHNLRGMPTCHLFCCRLMVRHTHTYIQTYVCHVFHTGIAFCLFVVFGEKFSSSSSGNNDRKRQFSKVCWHGWLAACLEVWYGSIVGSSSTRRNPTVLKIK